MHTGAAESGNVESGRVGAQHGRIERLGAESGSAPARLSTVCAAKKTPVRPATTVSSAPPAAKATTAGVPAAMALQGSQPEVLLSGEDQRAGRAQRNRGTSARGTRPAKRTVGPAESLQPGAVGALARDQQGHPQAVRRLDGEVDALVGQQPRQHQERAGRGAQGGDHRELGQADRRRDHGGRAVVGALNARGNHRRLGDEGIPRAGPRESEPPQNR